jgi:N-acetylglucosaminyldiphosphoundecaprenol N-acetyl-beta-D-mannosaminyltransferase
MKLLAPHRLPRKRILASDVTCASFQEVVDELCSLATLKKSSYVCIANVHMVIEAYQDPAFMHVMQEADVITPDGKPLSVCMNWLYGASQGRISGFELMLELFGQAQQKGLSVFLYGSTDEVLTVMEQNLKRDFPDLKIAGMISPPFRPLSVEEDEAIVQKIRDTGADLLFVSLGCPKQERWMAEHQGKIPAVMLGVGAAFPFYSGHLKRCPEWMQNLSLEWLFRLVMEPKRLFHRYFYTNSLFIFLMLKQMFRGYVTRILCLTD